MGAAIEDEHRTGMTKPIPEHHKEIADYLRSKVGGDPIVTAYRDRNSKRPLPIGQFGLSRARFYSTIGALDLGLKLPAGDFEFAACGTLDWLPNVVASSVYWLEERACTDWPLVCEDVVRDNAKSRYRHMAYVPSSHSLALSTGQRLRWLLGIPLSDNQIAIPLAEVREKARTAFPDWLWQ